MKTPKVVDSIVAEIEHLKDAEELLIQVWTETGPYGTKFSPELAEKIRKFFKFDDSE